MKGNGGESFEVWLKRGDIVGIEKMDLRDIKTINLMTESIETYFLEGCGRCPLGGTPECKVHSWTEELKYLRTIVLDCGLNEEMKWGIPCYTFNWKNVILLSAFKEYASISFFKGTLLSNENTCLSNLALILRRQESYVLLIPNRFRQTRLR